MQQDGDVAPTKIKLRHGDTLLVNTLVGTVQLNALRRFLAEGFQIHLQQNPLMHQIFNFEPREERAERLTPLEKKLYRCASSTCVLQVQIAIVPVALRVCICSSAYVAQHASCITNSITINITIDVHQVIAIVMVLFLKVPAFRVYWVQVPSIS